MELHVRPSLRRPFAVPLAFATLVPLLAGCATAAPSRSATSTPAPATASPSAEASPSASSAPGFTEPPDGSVIVTLKVADDQTYRILLTQADDIAIAYQLLSGEAGPGIPNGKVVRHGGEDPINHGYTWSIDSDDFAWADVTTEVCDGIPSDVEAGVVTSDRYCPWSAKVVAVDPL